MHLSAALGAVAIVTSGATFVLAEHASGPGRGHQRTVAFTVVERAESDTVIDNGTSGDSIGDVIAFGNPIYNASNTVRIGRNQGSCVRTNPGSSYECQWTLVLSKGTVVVQGPFNDSSDSTMAITGGTGRYDGASGQMVLHARDATSYDFRYTLHQ